MKNNAIVLDELTKIKGEAFIQLMCAMLSNPVIVESEKNFSVHGDKMLQLMRKYAFDTIDSFYPDVSDSNDAVNE